MPLLREASTFLGKAKRVLLRKLRRRWRVALLKLDDRRQAKNGRSAPGQAPININGRLVLARPTPPSTELEHQDALRNAILKRFQRDEVTHFVIPHPLWAPVTIGVLETERNAVLASLQALPEAPHLRVAPVRQWAPGRIARIRNLDQFPGQENRVRIVDFAYSQQPRRNLGSAAGINLEFWSVDEGGAWHAPTPNRYTSHVPTAAQERTTILSRAGELPTISPFSKPHIDDVTFPIDIVYTWVDGADKNWQMSRATALHVEDPNKFTERATDEARYRDHDELKYSLRSVERFAPWVNHIWIVTAGQVPAWLDTSHPKVTIVDHADIWSSEGILPTFNSHAIEAHLHRIQGLAEHFLYMNDDVFFGRRVSPETFFLPNGISRLFFSRAQIAVGPPLPGEIASDSAGKNARRLVEDVCGRTISQKFFHTPAALQRSVSYDLVARFPDEIRETAQSVFRRMNDVVVAGSLQMYYAYSTAQAVPSRINYGYLAISTPDAQKGYDRLLARRPQVFCLNDTGGEDSDIIRVDTEVRAFLETYFPEESTFEK